MEFYLSLYQRGTDSLDLVLKSSLDEGALVSSLKAGVRQVSADLPMTGFRPMAELVDRAVSPRRFFTILLSVFASFAVVLAALGIYGVIQERVMSIP